MKRPIVLIASLALLAFGVAIISTLVIRSKRAATEEELAVQQQEGVKVLRSDAYGFQVTVPDKLFHLNLLSNNEQAILIDAKPISFNDFLNGYYAPITVGPRTSEAQAVIDAIINAEERAIQIDGMDAVMITGELDIQAPLPPVPITVIVIPGTDLVIIGRKEFATEGFDYEATLNSMLETMQIF